MPDRVVWLSVGESGSGSGAVFGWHVRLDGAVGASNLALSAPQSQAGRDLGWQDGQLFEQGRVPQLAKDQLLALGAQLFELWLAPCWDKLAPQLKLGDQRLLVVGSDRPAVLNLPWELLRPAGGEAIGADGKWGLRRLPWAERPL